jgi:hypothetical protein
MNNSFFTLCSQQSDNKNDPNYIGRYGKMTRILDEQYLIEYKGEVVLSKKFVDMTSDSRVYVKNGEYKGKIGRFLSTQDAYLRICLDATGRIISSHAVNSGDNTYKMKKISPNDVFYMDLLLKNGKFFQVNSIIDNEFIGIEKNNNEFTNKTISYFDIYEFLPGFRYTCNENSNENTKTDDDNIYESMETDQDQQDDEGNEDSNEIAGYQDEEEYQGGQQEEYEQEESEMKQTFRDVERIGYIQRQLTSDEKDILKRIEKISLGLTYPMDMIPVYHIVEKTLTSIENIRKLCPDNNWKKNDIKYIVGCLVAYEIIKNGHKLSINDIVNKLYNSKFYTKTDITSSMFLRNDVNAMTDEKVTQIKGLYKDKKYEQVLSCMFENCHCLLQKWCEYFTFDTEKMTKNEIVLIPVSKSKVSITKEYPKYFLTTKDLINDIEIPESANKILWGPNSEMLVKKWKDILISKAASEKDEKTKAMYEFVISNFDNAPFLCKKHTAPKYKELQRVFARFIAQLRIHYEKLQEQKNEVTNERLQKCEKVNKRRRELELERSETMNFEELSIN